MGGRQAHVVILACVVLLSCGTAGFVVLHVAMNQGTKCTCSNDPYFHCDLQRSGFEFFGSYASYNWVVDFGFVLIAVSMFGLALVGLESSICNLKNRQGTK